MSQVLTAAQVFALASAYPDWDPDWVVWQVFDAGTGNGESSGRADVIDPSGKYVGLMQIDWRLHGYTVAEMQDPAKNIATAHRLWLESGIKPWPSAKNYPGKAATTMTDGVCPFAEQIKGGLDKAPNAGGFYDMVGICDHAAGGFYGTLMDPGFWQSTGVSVNFAIARDGRIGQILNLFTAPYGQGRDQDGRSIDPSSRGISWPHWAEMGKRNPNVFMVAVEHEDYVSIGGVSRQVTGSEWTLDQYNADLRLKRWMVDEVKRVQGRNLLRFGIDSLADHHMFDPVNRANCAGPFWRNNYRAQLYADLTGGLNEMANLNADGSARIVFEDGAIVVYNQNIPVFRFGGATPGELSKNFNGTWYNLSHLPQDDDPGPGQQSPAVWSNTLTD